MRNIFEIIQNKIKKDLENLNFDVSNFEETHFQKVKHFSEHFLGL